MTKKIFLTSVVAMGVICPVFASQVTSSFPTDGYMQENQTYGTAATYKNMGVYDGTVTANAEYTDTLYQISAGSYLPAGSEGIATTCPENSYCVGLTDATYSETADQGVTSCPSGFPNSSAGASAQTQCYTACTVSGAKIAHATAVTGKDYYGTGADTCAATACDNGYHVLSAVGVVQQTPLIPVDYTQAGSSYTYIDASGNNADRFTADLSEPNTWASRFDYGDVYGRASCRPSIHDAGIEYVGENVDAVMGGNMTIEEFRAGLEPISGTAKANYVADVLSGLKDGSKTELALIEALYVVFGIATDAEYSTTSTGQYCYCQMTGFAPADGDKTDVVSAPWVFDGDRGSASDCASSCAYYCASDLYDDFEGNVVFRGAVFGSLGAAAAGTCEANEISITWTDADPADVEANNAGMCVYDGDIRTPVRAATKPGKTFKGWKFVKTN